MSRHRQQPVRPRYGRITMLTSALAVTGIAVLGGTGVISSANGADDKAAAAVLESATSNAQEPVQQGAEPISGGQSPDSVTDSAAPTVDAVVDPLVDPAVDKALPPDSGHGRRIVFSESRQRVWLVEGGKNVSRTYLVSGSLSDNLDPGTYSVFSRSEQAYGVDDSGTMKYFVRFTQGDSAAIGFHDIPIDDGKRVQKVSQLGTPQSHGCIRQKRPDAIALWEFAPLGTTVVVTA